MYRLRMTNLTKSIGPLEKLKRWIGGCCWMSTLSNSKTIIPLVCESKYATTSLVASSYSKNLIIKKVESGKDEIEQSKVHWSQLIEHDNGGEEVAEVSNVDIFKSLQRHPIWGQFFRTFGDGGMHDYGDLVVGKKFAEGGQAKLYDAHVIWKNEEANSYDEEHGVMWVLKVFKKGTLLYNLQKQWPLGMFHDYEERVKRHKFGEFPAIKYTCGIKCGTLLADGRFGFLLMKESEDLRTFINHKMKARIQRDCGPFSMELAFEIMYNVAKGVEWLHNLDIVHRDLKASNVLCAHFKKNSDKELHDFYVADFECSIGVVGTGFFRAPEILQAIKDKVVNIRPHLFTKASDIYSYGMVCYEVLTGKLPFEGHPIYDFDVVLSGQQLDVPHYVDEWVCDLLQRCWQFDPSTRPTLGEILRLLEANSKVCRRIKREVQQREMLPLEIQKNLIPIYEFEF